AALLGAEGRVRQDQVGFRQRRPLARQGVADEHLALDVVQEQVHAEQALLYWLSVNATEGGWLTDLRVGRSRWDDGGFGVDEQVLGVDGEALGRPRVCGRARRR